MNFLSPFIILPITGLIIGWLTNWIAIKLLFIPKKPIFGIQGLVPKRKEKIASKIAEASLSFLPSKMERLTKLPVIGDKIIAYIKKEIKQKVHSMDDKQLQIIIERVAKKELAFIQISGAVLGAIIGLIQAVIISLI